MKAKPKNFEKYVNKVRKTSPSNESNSKTQNKNKKSNKNYDNSTHSAKDFWEDINNKNYKISHKKPQTNHLNNTYQNINFQNFNFSKSFNNKNDDLLLLRYKKLLNETENCPRLQKDNSTFSNNELYSQNITSTLPTYRKHKKYYNNSVDNNKNILSVWNRNKKWLDNKKKKIDKAVSNQIKMENKMLSSSFEPKLNKHKSSEDIKKFYAKKKNVVEKPENWRYFIRCYQGRCEKEYFLDFYNKIYRNDVFLKRSHYSEKNNCTNISQSSMNKFKKYLYNELRELM